MSAKGQATRAAILDAAMRQASAEGFRALSLGDLGNELGLTKTGVALAFGNKEALQLAALDHAMRLFVATVFQPALQAPRGLARLEAVLANWIRWAEHPALPGGCPLVPATREWDDLPGPVNARLVASYRQWLDTLAELIRRAQRTGELEPAADPRQIAFEIYGIVLTMHHAQRLLCDPAWKDRAERAFAGLLARHRHPPSPTFHSSPA